jgi:U3 small nucleolar ribonucleoprotein protein IMP3
MTYRYNKLCGSLISYAHRVSQLPAQDPFRARMESQLLSKLYDIGVLNSAAKLSDVGSKLTVAAFCRRRLAVFMCMSKMSETVSAVGHFIKSHGGFFNSNHTFRLLNSLNKVTYELERTPSRTLHI